MRSPRDGARPRGRAGSGGRRRPVPGGSRGVPAPLSRSAQAWGGREGAGAAGPVRGLRRGGWDGWVGGWVVGGGEVGEPPAAGAHRAVCSPHRHRLGVRAQVRPRQLLLPGTLPARCALPPGPPRGSPLLPRSFPSAAPSRN